MPYRNLTKPDINSCNIKLKRRRVALKERDEFGRFLANNKAATGNKGNTLPKYGNSNALKHGLYSNPLGRDNTLLYLRDKVIVILDGKPVGSLPTRYWHIENEALLIRTDVAEILINEYGMDELEFQFPSN